MESVAGSVQRDNEDSSPEKGKAEKTPGQTPEGPSQYQYSIFGRLKKTLGYEVQGVTPGETPGGPVIDVPVWEEFPWKKYLVEEDIIKKWSKVDMKVINNLHSHFDPDTGEFMDIQLEKVSVVQPVRTYSEIEGLTSQVRI